MSLKPGQIKCINTLDEPLVVAAGAGSGKTFTLTRRIVHALESGYVSDIDNVLAITFTNKAAGELKSRIKGSLRDAGMLDQALKVDEAWISTIHGMCSRILRAHAIELGIDPQFEIADEAALSQYLADAIETALLEMRSEQPQRLDDLFAEYSATSSGRGTSVESMIARLVGEMSANPLGRAAIVLPSNDVSAVALLVDAVNAAESLLALSENVKSSAKRDTWMQSTEAALEKIHAALGEGDVSPKAALEMLSGVSGASGFGTADFKEYAKQVALQMQMDSLRIRLSAARANLQTVLDLSYRASDLFSQIKRNDGVLDNNDLLVAAAHAIKDYPSIAAEYVDKFQLIMVDEFQDTDQMQIDMIKCLAGDGAKRLCTVGDAQQSIYRFRGADVSVYRRHLHEVESMNPEDVIHLPDNFRSHRDVLSLVDRVFERDDMFGNEFMSLSCSRDEAQVKKPFMLDGPRVTVLHSSLPHKQRSIQLLRQVNAKRIALKFAEYKAAGHSAGDMVILLGTMTNAGIYAQAVRDAGLACVITGGSVFNGSVEAIVVRELAVFLANPHQTQSLYNVLSSPMFGLNGDDFINLATSLENGSAGAKKRTLDDGLRFCARACADAHGLLPEGMSPQLRLAVEVLRESLGKVGVEPVSSIANRAIVNSGWLSRLEGQQGEGQAKAANVYKALRILANEETSCAIGPSELAERFTSVLENAKEAPGALSVTGGNFVRIMTMHASKGLEFPIVAVGEMKDVGADSSSLLVSNAAGRIFVSLDMGRTVDKLGGVAKPQNSVLDACVDEFADEDDIVSRLGATEIDPLEMRALMRRRSVVGDSEEAKRLLYVALTRAKEALVVSTFGTRTKDCPNGQPGNVLSSVGVALTGGLAGFDAGVSSYDFGGSKPARVDHLAFETKDDAEQWIVGDNGQDEAARNIAVNSPSAASSGFDVPVLPVESKELGVVYAPANKDVFSYSSISESSHGGDLLQNLADAYATQCDDAAQEGFAGSYISGDGRDPYYLKPYSALIEDDDDASWAFLSGFDSEDDDATNLGTAFHRLAQYSVRMRGANGGLVRPSAERERALKRTYGVSPSQARRLDAALDRWFASDLAQEMVGFAALEAEVPFFVSINADNGMQINMEGEIDLLAKGEDGSVCFVDYKTGGSCDESSDRLKKKHVLQAVCYAYALLRQGFTSVDAVFVRVEHARADASEQPQTVRYHFEASDEASLESAICKAYRMRELA